jgi:hypothetical protein
MIQNTEAISPLLTRDALVEIGEEKLNGTNQLPALLPSPKTRVAKSWGLRFAVAAKASEAGLYVSVVKHLYRKVAVAFFAALISSRLQPLFYFSRFFGRLCDDVM